MEYYNSNDLLKRRTDIALWMCAQNKKITNHYNYGELLSNKYIMNLEYIAGAMEAMGCYVPVTVSTDGIDNCLKESQLDKLFNNVTIITGLCWQPKCTTYRNELDDPTEIGFICDTAGDPITTVGGNGQLGVSVPPVPTNINIIS